jgi:hypothetical protein
VLKKNRANKKKKERLHATENSNGPKCEPMHGSPSIACSRGMRERERNRNRNRNRNREREIDRERERERERERNRNRNRERNRNRNRNREGQREREKERGLTDSQTERRGGLNC